MIGMTVAFFSLQRSASFNSFNYNFNTYHRLAVVRSLLLQLCIMMNNVTIETNVVGASNCGGQALKQRLVQQS